MSLTKVGEPMPIGEGKGIQAFAIQGKTCGCDIIDMLGDDETKYVFRSPALQQQVRSHPAFAEQGPNLVPIGDRLALSLARAPASGPAGTMEEDRVSLIGRVPWTRGVIFALQPLNG